MIRSLAPFICAPFVYFVVSQVRVAMKRRRLELQSWESIAGELLPVDLKPIGQIADCYLRPNDEQLPFTPREMLSMVGGFYGLHCLLHNLEIMLDLAMYAERWNDDDGRAIAEMMRRDSIRVRQGIRRVRWAYLSQIGILPSALSLQESLASYHMMRARLLGLYAKSHVGLLERLERQLG